jgi:phosphate transport system protein
MGQLVGGMVRDAIDAFVARDVPKALAVIERDDELDEAYHSVFRRLLAIMTEDTEAVERGIHIQSVAKFLERMGDHATNLAEQVIYLSHGTDVRHFGKL